MTKMRAKQHELLRQVSMGHGGEGIYALAKDLKRPYRRVLGDIRTLETLGRLRTERATRGGRDIVRVLAVMGTPQPRLQFAREWSAPGESLPAETVIASVLSRPTFGDLLSVSKTYGLPAVKKVYRDMIARLELPAVLAAEDARMLRNIEVGFARASQ